MTPTTVTQNVRLSRHFASTVLFKPTGMPPCSEGLAVDEVS